MTFQPPPPPPGSTPPPPPPARGPGGSFDPKTVNKLDWAIMGIGAVLLIFSFFDYYSVSVGPYSDSAGAWHFGDGGILAWLAFIAGLAGAVIVALGYFAPTVRVPVATYLGTLVLFTASTVLYILGFLVIGPDDGGCGGVSACENAIDDAFSFGFSYWLSFILVIAGIGLSVVRAQQTNTALPGPLNNIPKIG